MALSVSVSDLIVRARRHLDNENAATRFPDAEVLDYINLGGAELYDFFVSIRAWPWVGKTYLTYTTVVSSGTSPPTVSFTGTPTGDYAIRIEITTGATLASTNVRFKWSINGGTSYTTGVTAAATVALGNTGITANFASGTYTADNVYTSTVTGLVTVANQATYELPSDFYKMHSVLVTTNTGAGSFEIFELGRQEEALARVPSVTSAPVGYILTGARVSTAKVTFFPQPTSGSVVRLNYYPNWTNLTTSDSFDGIDGWDLYLSKVAAKLMAEKDENWDAVGNFRQDLRDLEKRFKGLIPTRTTTLPRIQNRRHSQIAMRARRWWP